MPNIPIDVCNEEVIILKTYLNLLSRLLEIDFPTFLIFLSLTSPKVEILQLLNTVFIYNFRNLGFNIKNVGKLLSSRLGEKFKSVFRILIASLDQLVCLAKNTSKILCSACVRQKQKITVSNPLNK